MQTHPARTPGTALKDLLEKNQLKQSEAAKKLEISEALLSLMIKDKARITTDMAVKIERVIGGSADQLVYPQLVADLAKAREAA
ncbi:HigA family addiction module antidote protein [Caballeronia sp. EK]|uniref:HigA family addiction module antitoxin n=1 Tax=Caballeronia sp. EK TaxID=2767469 RepID=UPI0016566DBD|nr:HigA family addiction module antitoxin [Caballeronia sp. EK]MBC8640180.1 HigA family addiction module antidote protein [Caballeronia sp. EK]